MSEYNGYTNYETWAVNLWLTNEYGDYEHMMSLANESDSLYDLSEAIEQYVMDIYYEFFADILGTNMFSDLLTSSLNKVDWRDIAEYYWHDRETEYEVRFYYALDHYRVVCKSNDHSDIVDYVLEQDSRSPYWVDNDYGELNEYVDNINSQHRVRVGESLYIWRI